jgi:hypothetical protein
MTRRRAGARIPAAALILACVVAVAWCGALAIGYGCTPDDPTKAQRR